MAQIVSGPFSQIAANTCVTLFTNVFAIGKLMPKYFFATPLMALLLVPVLLAGCTKEQPVMPPPTVSFLVVKKEPIVYTTKLSGRTSAFQVAEVRPQVSGIIQKRYFEEGADVVAGTVLYQIDPALYEAAYQNALAAQTRAEATSKVAKLLASRYAELVKVKAVSRQEFDNAQADYERSMAEIIASKAAVDTAKINLDYTRVTAPISGRIGRSAVTPGALVTQNQPNALAVIQQVDKMYVDVSQSSQEALHMREKFGQSPSDDVKLVFQDGTAYDQKGQLEFFDITVNQSTDTINVRIIFPNEKGIILPGMFVQTVITQGADPQGVLIPQKAVSRDANGNFIVLVLSPSTEPGSEGMYKVEARTITVSRSLENQWHVSGGLNEGDRVLVEGLQKARPGAFVRGRDINAPQQAPQAAPGAGK